MIRKRRFVRAWLAVCVLSALALIVQGCAYRPGNTAVQSPYTFMGEGSGGAEQPDPILERIKERNLTIEDNPEWIQKAYSQFMIRNLLDVSNKEYANYAKYLDKGSAYIVVHPAYYAFFHDDSMLPSAVPEEVVSDNAVDKLISESSYSGVTRVVKAQEKMLRDFLEYASTERKLIILVLPKNYLNYQGYKYKGKRDEFMRFINEVSNESDSVLYMYSKRAYRGTLNDKDKKTLLKFLYGVKANSILLGGGYIGRCMEDFYKDIEPYFGDDKIYVVPEITAISPSDITSDAVAELLRSDGTINVGKMTLNIRTNALGTQESAPLIKNLSISDQAR